MNFPETLAEPFRQPIAAALVKAEREWLAVSATLASAQLEWLSFSHGHQNPIEA
jgi:hypothetical protein